MGRPGRIIDHKSKERPPKVTFGIKRMGRTTTRLRLWIFNSTVKLGFSASRSRFSSWRHREASMGEKVVGDVEIAVLLRFKVVMKQRNDCNLWE